MLKIKVTNVFQTNDKEKLKEAVNKRIESLIKRVWTSQGFTCK